jgi:hypothetical protein
MRARIDSSEGIMAELTRHDLHLAKKAPRHRRAGDQAAAEIFSVDIRYNRHEGHGSTMIWN